MSVQIATAEAMRDLAQHVVSRCHPGDVIVLVGDLGAGKTTFSQGVGRALGVQEQVTSPTFVIARVYSGAGGFDLVHVDAYRLASAVELDDLDLDADLAASLTVIEWGEGKAEQLSSDRLHVLIERGDREGEDTRTVSFHGHGSRWSAAEVAALEPSW